MELFLCITDYFRVVFFMADENICSREVVIWASTYLMEGSSEMLPVFVSLPRLFELLLSKIGY